MNLEVKPTKSQHILSKIGLALIITCLPVVLYFAFALENNVIGLTFCSLLFVILEGVFVISFFNASKTLIVENEQITLKEGFNTNSLLIKEIEGFWQERNFVYFIPFNKSLKRIRIKNDYVGFEKLISWAESNLDELRWSISFEEEDEILHNVKYGKSEDERETKLDLAKGLTKLINILATLISIFTFWILQFYKVQLLICLAIPLIAIVLVSVFKGLIKIHYKEFSWAYPSVIPAVAFPLLMVLFRVTIDFDMLNRDALWFPCSLVFCFIFILTWFSLGREYLVFTSIKTYYGLLTIFLVSTAYSFAFVSATNVIFDTSRATRYKVEILDKTIGTGRVIIPYLELNSWELENKKTEIPVSWELYHYSSEGDSVDVYVRKGFYNAPYYGVY